MTTNDLCFTPAVEVAEMIRRHGVPVSIKDNLWTAGDRTTSGSRLLAEFVPREDTPSVATLRAAGAIFVGRTNLPEFAWRGSTDNPLFGESRNPWDLTRTPGGSTGGGAAAVAAGLAPLALGSDGAGSIRIPASFCGLVGLKPTFGRVPMYPAAGGNELVAHVCPLSRTVRDAALMMSVIARYDRRDPFALPDDGVDYLAACEAPLVGARGTPVRVAWSGNLGFAPVEPETLEIAAAAARAFADIGVEVEEASPDLGDPSWILRTLYGSAQAGAHAARPPEEKARMDPALVAYAEASARLTAVEYLKAVSTRQAMVDVLQRFFERYDLLLTPTADSRPSLSRPAGRRVACPSACRSSVGAWRTRWCCAPRRHSKPSVRGPRAGRTTLRLSIRDAGDRVSPPHAGRSPCECSCRSADQPSSRPIHLPTRS